MNIQQINEWRAAHGLAPIVAKTTRASRVRQAHNQAARAAQNRAIREARNRGK